MKIAIVTTGLLPIPASKGGAVENLIDFFLEENEKKRTVDVTVYSSFDQEAEKLSNKFRHAKFVYINTNSITYAIFDWLLIKIARIFRVGRLFGYLSVWKMRKTKFDVVIVENYPFHCTSIKQFIKSPVILHTHNRYVENSYKLLYQYINYIDGLICVSDFIAHDAKLVQEKHNIEFPISVAHNGIHIERFFNNFTDIEKSSIRKKYNIPGHHKIIIFTGRIIPAKGVKELLQAFSMLPCVNACTLLVIGSSSFSGSSSTPYIDEVKSLADKLNGNVKFTGYIDYCDIPSCYAIADIQVVPSIWEEPAGLVSLEGMASGIPIVCSDSGGTPEHVTDDCAIIVKRGDGYVERLSEAMNKLIANDNLRRKMGIAGRKRSELFSTSCYYENMIISIKEVLGEYES